MTAIRPRFLNDDARVLRPGILSLPPGVERYSLPGLGSLVVRMQAGDRLRVMDSEGGQTAEIIACRTADGICQPELLSVRGDGQGEGITSLLLRGDAAALHLRESLDAIGISLDSLRSIKRFGPESQAGDEADFVAAESATVIVTAPGDDMPVDGCNPPTSLVVFVERIALPTEGEPSALPPPLAAMREDFRINRATARAYNVRAGEWIQIIDVEGRQCTDFQAFCAASLDKGAERCLDVTASRTLAGRSHPIPGLHSKYHDRNFQPLVEIVQDSCSRHDAFGLACSAKYYEDLGYPGHVNCSDNFNGALSPYGVAPRRGWMSMNFFFNSEFCERTQTFATDEPWSRPGDYVLLRALTDLVCVSSACPDDVYPANGWNPTEIHVRTYPPDLRAKKSIFFRKRTDSEAEMTKETGFHAKTAELTRDFIEYGGYWLPSQYTSHGAMAEYWACREKAVVMDLSPLRKFEILGPDAESLLQHCLTRNIRRLGTGQVVYTAMCYDTGTMIDDGTVFRLGDNNFRWIGGSDASGEWLQKQAKELNLNVRVKPSTDQLHNIAVQGPMSRDILKEILWTPPDRPKLTELDWFRFTVGRISDSQGAAILVSRTGYTGELGYEIFCHPKDAPAVWDKVIMAGGPHGLIPFGFDALDMVRIEAGLVFAGYEFDDQTDPFEAGIGFTVALKNNPEDFIGRTALESRKANPQRTLIGLELSGEETASHGDPVFINRQQIGIITSATRSPILAKNIALCRIASQHSQHGTNVQVGKLDGHQKRLPAIVVPFPFYDPQKEKPRA